MKIIVQKAELLAMLKLASVDESRFVLCGLHFEVNPKLEQILIVATDGRMIGVLRVGKIAEPPPEIKKVTVPLNKRDLRGLPEGELLLAFTETHVTIEPVQYERKKQTLTVEIHLRDYPRWRSVIPEKEYRNPFNGWMNPILIAKWNEAVCLLSGGLESPGVRFWYIDQTNPILVECMGLPEFTLLVMPMREANPVDAIKVPDWVFKLEPVAETPLTP